MAKIFLVISILVSALTAGLAFKTNSNVTNLNAQKTSAEQATAKAQADTNKAKGELANSIKEVDAQKLAVKGEQDKTAAATSAKEKVEKDLAAAQKEKEELATSNKDLQDKLAKQPAPVQDAGPAKSVKDDPAYLELASQVEVLKKEQTKAVEEKNQAQSREKEATGKLADMSHELERYKGPIRQNRVTGRVTAVNPGWNFVVVSVGDKLGATVNAPLLVMRQGQVVGRLRITSVEPGSSIADVIQGSVMKGNTVQPGDMVVFSGRENGAGAPKPKDAAADANAGGGSANPSSQTKPDAASGTLPSR